MAHDTPASDGPSGWLARGPLAPVAGLEGHRLDVAMTALVLWSVVGVVLDVRSHIEGLSFAEEGFLTPEHAMFYSGFLGVLALLALVTARRRAAGRSLRAAVPPGYGAGAVGLVLFGLGGPGDFLWHTAFGAEANAEALTSPTHLLLGAGGAAFVSSPLRAAYRRVPEGWRGQFPLVVSATLTLTLLTVFTLYSHPLVRVFPADPAEVADGLTGVVLHAAILAGLLVVLVRRFTLPPGAVTVVVGANGVAMAFLGGALWLAPWVALAGVVGDGLALGLRPSLARPAPLRAFAFGAPAAYAACYLLGVALGPGVAWTLHLWTGTVALAGFAGLLVSYVALPSGVADGVEPSAR